MAISTVSCESSDLVINADNTISCVNWVLQSQVLTSIPGPGSAEFNLILGGIFSVYTTAYIFQRALKQFYGGQG